MLIAEKKNFRCILFAGEHNLPSFSPYHWTDACADHDADADNDSHADNDAQADNDADLKQP